MKKSAFLMPALVLVIGLMLSGLLASCGDDTSTSSNNAIPNNEFSKTGTVQGTIFDATTGARLTGSALSVTLIRGSSYISPDILKNESTETTFAGDYAFTGIPVTINNSATYRIVATNTGYQQFEAYVTLNATAPISDDTTGNDNNQTIDTEYSVIGNIYMFPLGTTAGDISIYVEYDNERVVGATVQLQQNIANNTTTTQITGRLTPSSGTLTNFTATTDANGLATFSSDLLVLGGHYEVRVLPATHEGLQLALTSGTDIVAGTSNNTQLVNITDTEPGTQTDALYAVLATNNDSDDATGTTNPGRLQITFNRAIAIYSEDGFTATLTNAGAAALTDPAGPGSVTASLSTDGLTLILTPNFATSPTAADLGCDITYVSGGITLDGDEQGDSLNIFNVNDIAYLDGTAVSNTVHIIGSD